MTGVLTGIVLADRGEQRVAERLVETGVRTTASGAEVHVVRVGRAGALDADAVRAVVDLPHGPAEVYLVGAWVDGEEIGETGWHPAPAPYAGTFDVLRDPQDAGTVMAVPDVEHAATGDDVETGAVLLGGAGAWTVAFAWPVWRSFPESTRAAVRRRLGRLWRRPR